MTTESALRRTITTVASPGSGDFSMKKTVLTFGSIAGAVMAVMLAATAPFADQIGFDRMAVIGYTSMVLAFLMIYFGIRSYRDNVAGGHISFGKALQVGLSITAIAAVCYVITWEILYFTVAHDFIDKYAAYMIEKARAAGQTEAAVQKLTQDMADFKQMYQNPFINAALTFLEPLPVGIVMTLVSAAILRTKPGASAATQTA
jgi:hypothetical protein